MQYPEKLRDPVDPPVGEILGSLLLGFLPGFLFRSSALVQEGVQSPDHNCRICISGQFTGDYAGFVTVAAVHGYGCHVRECE